MIKRLAIIPAREGSKRIKNKNIIPFFQKPLIYYSLTEAKKSKLFSKIHVSTDSIKIKNIVKKLGFEIDFLRDSVLANDHATIKDVVNFVINQYRDLDQHYDEVWLIYATNPFIKSLYLKNAYKLYLKNKKNRNIISVCKYNFPIFWAQKKKEKDKTLIPVFKNKIHKDSKSFDQHYCDAGMFVIYKKNFKNNNKNENYLPYEIPWWKSIDIDTYEDLEAAKKIYK